MNNISKINLKNFNLPLRKLSKKALNHIHLNIQKSLYPLLMIPLLDQDPTLVWRILLRDMPRKKDLKLLRSI